MKYRGIIVITALVFLPIVGFYIGKESERCERISHFIGDLPLLMNARDHLSDLPVVTERYAYAMINDHIMEVETLRRSFLRRTAFAIFKGQSTYDKLVKVADRSYDWKRSLDARTME